MLLLASLVILAVGCHADVDVFYVRAAWGRYKIPNTNEAEKLCKAYNAQLATLADLKEAQKNGLDQCNCGWLVGGRVGYALQAARPGCGDGAGIQYCPTRPQDWGNTGWDAYCKKDAEPSCPNRYSFGIPLAKYTIRQTDWAQVFLELKFPADGVVSGWEYYSLRHDMQAYVSVWRYPDPKNMRLQLVGRNRLPLGRVGHVKYFVEENYQIRVKKGDFIGLHYDSIIDWKSNNDAVIPMAQRPSNLCAEDGSCVKSDDLGLTLVMHRHEQQIAYARDVIIDVSKVSERLTKYRAPALRPIFCADNAGDLPATVTTTTAAPVTEPELTTPAETPEPTPEAPEITQTQETEPPTTEESEEETEGPTETTTEKASPPPTTTTTEAPTTTTTTAPAVTGGAEGYTEEGPDVAEAASKDTPCHIPFMYRKQMVYTCTSAGADKPWCSTSETYDGSNWRYCHEGDMIPEDMPCHFPFTYKDSEYSSCINAFSERPWCAVVPQYNQHSWKYCTDEDSVEAVPCHIPFEYKGVQHNMCIKQGSPNFWCATAAKYGTYSWRNCREGDPLPSSLPCHFPFKFEDKEISTCIDKGSNRHWCAVGAEYNGENWRNCKEGDVFPEERPCHFPFTYNGHEINQCISENSNRAWCSQVPVYNYQKDWKYCRNVELFLLHGQKVKSAAKAEKSCKAQNMILAMEREAVSAYETGVESCECGWVSSGKAVSLAQDPRADCNEGQERGVRDCGSSGEFIPVCVVE